MSERDEAWKAYEEWDNVTDDHLKLVHSDLAHALDVVHRLDGTGGLMTAVIKTKLIDIERLVSLRKQLRSK